MSSRRESVYNSAIHPRGTHYGMSRKFIWDFFNINSRSFFGFCLILALRGCNIGQKNGGRLTKTMPARQTHFGEFFGQPFGESTFSKNVPQKHTLPGTSGDETQKTTGSRKL